MKILDILVAVALSLPVLNLLLVKAQFLEKSIKDVRLRVRMFMHMIELAIAI